MDARDLALIHSQACVSPLSSWPFSVLPPPRPNLLVAVIPGMAVVIPGPAAPRPSNKSTPRINNPRPPPSALGTSQRVWRRRLRRQRRRQSTLRTSPLCPHKVPCFEADDPLTEPQLLTQHPSLPQASSLLAQCPPQRRPPLRL